MRASRRFPLGIAGSGVLAVAGGIALVVACGKASTGVETGSPPMAVFAPTILGNPNLIGMISTYSLSVYAANAVDGGLTCNPMTGRVAGLQVLTPMLFGPDRSASGAGCGGGDTRCFLNVKVPDSATVPRIFFVTGNGSNGQPIAYGCATQTLSDAATATVPIDMEPLTTSVCGNDLVEVGETCDPPLTADGGVECTSACQTVEQVLSSGSAPTGDGDAGSKTMTGKPGDKSNPSFVWPVAGNFLAFFGDTSSGDSQIDVRLLSERFGPSTALGPIAQEESFYLPNTAGVFPPSPVPGNQKQPAAAQVLSTGDTYVVFADDSATAGTFAISLRSLDSSLNPQQATACAISTPVTGASFGNPAIAAGGSPATELYIGWEDDIGNVYGRTYTPGANGACGALGLQTILSVGNGVVSSSVSLAGIQTGWVATWKSGSDIALTSVGTSGLVNGIATIEPSLHEGSQPRVASIPSGNDVSGENVGGFAVVWTDTVPGTSPTIFAQRYYGDNAPNMRDASVKGQSIEQATQISQSSNGGGEGDPFIVGCPTAGGAFVVAWADQGTGQVRGRLLSGSAGKLGDADGGAGAYLANTVDGTTNEFQVSVGTARPRSMTTVAVGGETTTTSGIPFIAFGWVDDSSTAPFGITARRFPTP